MSARTPASVPASKPTPSPPTSAASSCARSRERSATTTRAPSSAKRRTSAWPMPPVPPVMTACLSLSSMRGTLDARRRRFPAVVRRLAGTLVLVLTLACAVRLRRRGAAAW